MSHLFVSDERPLTKVELLAMVLEVLQAAESNLTTVERTPGTKILNKNGSGLGTGFGTGMGLSAETGPGADPETEAEYDYVQALDMTADVLSRLAQAKRHRLEGLSGMDPQDMLQQHIKMLFARYRQSESAR